MLKKSLEYKADPNLDKTALSRASSRGGPKGCSAVKNIVEIFDSCEQPYAVPCSLAIGVFDGLHIGHKKVMSALKRIARETKSEPCVLTFSPHPSSVIPMGRPPVEMLCSPETRAGMFEKAGAKNVFVKKFDKRFAAMSPDEFAEFLRANFPRLRGIVTGKNFVFGKNACGDFRTLKGICSENSWKYSAVKGVLRPDGERISSSLLRQAVRAADFNSFRLMAGYPYECFGKIVGGKKIGRTIGFPTLNLPWNPDCKPPFGVYAVELRREKGKGGRIYRGVANYGVAPTLGNLLVPTLETHVFGKCQVDTGDFVRVRLMEFIRGEKKFKNISALKKQIEKDSLAAKSFFENKAGFVKSSTP